MDRALDIIMKRYDEISEAMDTLLDNEIWMEEVGILTAGEKRANDRRWHELFVVRCELTSLYDEMTEAAKEMR